MNTPPLPPTGTKLTKAKSQGLTLTDVADITVHKTAMRIFWVSDSQLEELTAGYNSLYLIWFGVCVGAGVSLGIAWRETSSIADKPYYFAGFIASVGIAVLSGIAGFTNVVRATRRKAKLYRESVPIEK